MSTHKTNTPTQKTSTLTQDNNTDLWMSIPDCVWDQKSKKRPDVFWVKQWGDGFQGQRHPNSWLELVRGRLGDHPPQLVHHRWRPLQAKYLM